MPGRLLRCAALVVGPASGRLERVCLLSFRLPIQSNGAVQLTISLSVLSFDAVCLSVLRVGGTKFALPCLDPLALPCICGAALSNKWTQAQAQAQAQAHSISRPAAARPRFFSLCFAQAKQKSDSVALCQSLEFREKLNVIPFRPPFLASSPILNRQALDLPYQDRTAFQGVSSSRLFALHTIRYASPTSRFVPLHAHRCRILPLSTVLVVARSQSRRSALVCPRAHNLSFSVLRYC